MSQPDSIAHYRITAKLGQGGMGEVYRATDTKLGREVAIKVLSANVAEDPARMARFEREAHMLAALNHPNIAAIYGIEQGALVMELVAGDDLKGPLPVETALNYARQIAEGLEAAHEKGIIHRDLKPANIKVTTAGQVKILDFGLAKAAEEEPGNTGRNACATLSPTLSLEMTRVGMILGTAAYMSPEQARGKPVDKRADIWAFGAVLYEMLTGTMLFGGGETVSDSLAAVITKEPDWSALPKDTPPRIRRLLDRCLRKDPRQRVRDIGEARQIIDEAEPAAAAVAPVERRRQWAPWVAGLVVGATAMAGVTAWLRPKPADLGAARLLITLPEGTTEALSPATAQAAPSPDGRTVAFAAQDKSSGKHVLWVRPLGSLTAHKLDLAEGASFPFWSPDSQFLGFFADGKLKRIAVAGGAPQTLCDAGFANSAGESGDGGTWNREGVIVFAPGAGALMRVPASGGLATPVTTLNQQELNHSWPQFLADGRHLLYFARNRDPEKSGIYVQEAGSSQRILVLKNRLRAAWSPPGYLLFVRESTLLAQGMNAKTFQLEGEPIPVAQEVSTNEGNGRAAFAVDNGVLVYRGGTVSRVRPLAWYDREGKRLGPAGKAGDYLSVMLAPDEKSAAVVTGSGANRDTWILDLASGILTRMTLDTQSSYSMGPWSPDSQRLAVNHVGGGISEITVASGKMRVLAPAPTYASDWSPDGGSLLCVDWGHRLSVLPLTGESGLRTMLDTPYRKQYLRLSPDGKWAAYSSEESGRFEVSVAAFPSFAEKRQVSSAGGGASFWRKNGKELLFLALDGTLMSAEIKVGSRIEVGIPKRLFQVSTQAGLPGSINVAPTRDGERFLVIEGDQSNQQAQIRVVLNWAAELKQ